MTIHFVAILLLLCLSAFFSASEMAFSSANQLRLENLAEEGDKRARRALKITKQFDNALSTILIGNNLVNVAASAVSSVLVIITLGDKWTWVATVSVTVLVIIFGETIPKIYAKKYANKLSLALATPISVLMALFKPLVFIVVKLVNLIIRLFPKPQAEAEAEEKQELQSIIETAESENVLDKDQSELVQAALGFDDTPVKDVMTARVDILAINIEDEWDEILEITNASPYSRLPVYKGSIDNVIGVLYLNRLYRALVDESRPKLQDLMSEPVYLYKTTKLQSALDELNAMKQHLAIVTDEYGGTLGVVTMEDILEELVGEIWDETDTIEEGEVATREDGSLELDGDMSLSDFLDLMHWKQDDENSDSDTVGGWTIERYGTFPRKDDSFVYKDKQFTVLEADELRVKRVLVKDLRKES